MRQEFPAKVKTAAFERANGHCERCTAPLVGSNRPQYDHRIPAAIDGDPTLENCVCLCKSCHDLKTHTRDVPEIAKTKRIRAKHVGARKPSPPMPGSRKSKWKRKMDGTVVKR